ncbi:MAG: methylated-DNA--[protein]-cysteine S-methyltransferase [Planctomycetota bacterium]
MAPNLLRSSIHSTPLGPMVSKWTDAGLFSLVWDADGSGEKCDAKACRLLDAQLERYFKTGASDFSEIDLDTSGWSRFHHLVYERCREIPTGETVTYKTLATRAGNAAASRAVGAAMARNRVLLVIPCHRVISAGGGLRGFSAPGGLETKRYLLDLESKQSFLHLEAPC